MVGKIIQEDRLVGSYHHDQFEMEDETFLVMVKNFYRNTLEDMLVGIE